MRTLRILSLGGGVQSTTILLMVKRGQLAPIDAAIFADPQEESDATYAHLEWLKRECAGVCPIITRSAGSLGDSLVLGNKWHGGRYSAIPAFQSEHVGGPLKALGRRQCTADYKTRVVEQAIRRDVLGLRPRQRCPKDVSVTQIIGLSYDEPSRVIRVRERFARDIKWATPEFPLFARQMTRGDCVSWLANYGVPHETPRSACVFCPFHSNAEWRRIKEEDPKGWARAVEIDEAIRNPASVCNRTLKHIMWLHRSCVPLADADLRERDQRIGQTIIDFSTECLGMCGN